MGQTRELSILFALTSMDCLLWGHLRQGTPGPDLSPQGVSALPNQGPCSLGHLADLPAAPGLALGVEPVSTHRRAELPFYR